MLDIKRALAALNVLERTETFPLETPWGAELSARLARDPGTVPLPEHPRPTLVRDRFTVLNGRWDYAIVTIPGTQGDAPLDAERALETLRAASIPAAFDGTITVPFSPEAALSGVGRTVEPSELLWYRRTVDVPEREPGERLVLHFDAVDWACALWVDGRLAATHVGGYLPFDIDITSYADEATGGTLELALGVYDPSDAGVQPRGKQRLEPGGIWYTAQSGIWQTAWFEVAGAAYIAGLTLNGAADGALEVEATVRDPAGLLPAGAVLEIAAEDTGDAPFRATIPLDAPGEPDGVRLVHARIEVGSPRLWSPDDPFLHEVTATLSAGEGAIDTARSYCAFRTVKIARDREGVARMHLNGEPVFLKGVLDQGYWPESLMTAPADEALVHDIEAMRDAGFTMMRKHLKVESARWYYHCDSLGMLVWQDAVQGAGPYDPFFTSKLPTAFRPSWGMLRDDTPRGRAALSGDDEAYRTEWLATCEGMVRLLKGHPSIVTWVLFNEGFGQFDARAVTERVHALDPSRPIDAVSGWYDQHCGDYLSHHNYFRPLTVCRDRGRLSGYAAARGYRAYVISEFGGWSQPIQGHTLTSSVYGYGNFDTVGEWRAFVRGLLGRADALGARGLAGYVYTQLSDVEDELNGILTYDRRVNKLADGS